VARLQIAAVPLHAYLQGLKQIVFSREFGESEELRCAGFVLLVGPAQRTHLQKRIANHLLLGIVDELVFLEELS